MKNSASLAFSPFLKHMLLGIALLNSLAGTKRMIESFLAPQVYKKDFAQEYLMAKSILAGENPYRYVTELAGRWMRHAEHVELKHPAPHPPFVALLGLPFSVLSYETATFAWLIVELVCLSGAMAILLRWWGAPVRAGRVALLLAFALGWAPVAQDLWFGQVTTLLLALLLGAWQALRSRNDALGGALLGAIIALKLLAWPLVLFLALRRRWSGVLASVAVVIAANASAAAVIGFESVKYYYLQAGPMVGEIYRAHDSNFSAWTWGHRLFTEFGRNFLASPLLPSPLFARLFAVLAPVAVLLLGLRLALKARDFDSAFGVLVITGILVSPIAWTHYSMLALIPMAVIARKLWAVGWPKRHSYQAFCSWLPLSLTQSTYVMGAWLFANGASADGLPSVPFAAGMLTAIPAIALLGLLRVVWRLDAVKVLPRIPRAAAEGVFDNSLPELARAKSKPPAREPMRRTEKYQELTPRRTQEP